MLTDWKKMEGEESEGMVGGHFLQFRHQPEQGKKGTYHNLYEAKKLTSSMARQTLGTPLAKKMRAESRKLTRVFCGTKFSWGPRRGPRRGPQENLVM